MALGIFAFAIIPVIGLMGTGLKASKESINASTTAQIFRIADALVASDASVTTTNMFFSNEGEQTDSSDAVFKAVVSPLSPNDAAGGLLVRKMWQVQIVNPAATNVIYSTRSIQVSRDLSTNDFR